MQKFLIYYKKLSLAARSALWFAVCTFIQKGISMITTPIFTRLMSSVEYGELAVYNSWIYIIDIFATFELTRGVFNKAMIKYKDDKDGYTSSTLFLTSIITIITACAFFSMLPFFSKYVQIQNNLLVMMFLQIFFQAPLTFWTARNKFDYEYKKVVFLSLFINISVTLLSLYLVINHTENKAFYKILGSLCICIVVNTILYFRIIRKGGVFYNKEYWKYSVVFSIPLLPHFLSQQILTQSDRIMISNICGQSDAAMYSVSYTLSSALLLIINALQSSFVPWTYRKLEIGEITEINKRSYQIFVICGVVCVLFPLLGPEFIWILGGENYKRAVYVIPPIAMSVLYTMLYSLFSNIEMYFEKTQYVMIASCTAAILNLALNAFFIPSFGFAAAGYTTLFCYIVLAIMHFFMVLKICKQNGVPNLFPYRKMWLISFAFTSISLLSVFTYKSLWIRYIIIIISIVLIMILHKAKLINFKSVVLKK